MMQHELMTNTISMNINVDKLAIFLFLAFAFFSCAGDSTLKETFLPRYDTLLKHENIIIYRFTDQDSITNIVGTDDEGSFRDTARLNYGINSPDILLRDINHDGINDVIVIFDFSDPVTLIRYWGYFSSQNPKLAKPKIVYKGNEVDFFNNNDILNTNMRVLSNDTFMFQHSYSEVCFYRIKQLEMLPLVKIQRDSNFRNYFIWETSKNDWGNSNQVEGKNYWIELTLKNWSKPFFDKQ